MRKTICLLLALALAGLSAPSGLAEARATKDFFAMDTHISITACGGDAEALSEALDAAEALLLERERRWSVTLEDSDIGRINRADGEATGVSEETAALLSCALEMAERTGGAYDPTVYPLVRAWGFTTGEYRVPEAEEIEALLELVDHAKVSLDGDKVQLPAGMQLDLGGIAKGCAAGEAAALLKERGVASALLNLGGNVHALGGKADGSAWRIGVKSPSGGEMLGVLSLRDQCAITSGAYERCFTGEDGKTYGHILDPDTGYPAEGGLLSVTIVGSDGGTCDALSTALFVMGADEALDFWRASGDFEMVALTDEGVLYVTEGVAGAFEAGASELVREVRVVEK